MQNKAVFDQVLRSERETPPSLGNRIGRKKRKQAIDDCLGYCTGIFLGQVPPVQLIGDPSLGVVTWKNSLFLLYSCTITTLTILLMPDV